MKITTQESILEAIRLFSTMRNSIRAELEHAKHQITLPKDFRILVDEDTGEPYDDDSLEELIKSYEIKHFQLISHLSNFENLKQC